MCWASRRMQRQKDIAHPSRTGWQPSTVKNFTWATVMGHYSCGLLARETLVPTNAKLQV